ncbi:MAG: beta-galactosidase [Ktedonobacteraceae bacterium]
MTPNIRTNSIIVFHDHGYPHAYTEATLAALVPGEFQITDASGLATALERECTLLISFHGPYFPKQAWGAIHRFLQGGGNIAMFGGMPFTRPIGSDGKIEPEQDSYTKQIYLGPVFQLTLTELDLCFVPAESAAFLENCPLSISAEQPGNFWVCYPKLTQASDHPEDSGSTGPIDTILTPLLFVQISASTTHLATPAFLLDQRQGIFRGGRWLISAWQPSSERDWLVNAEAIRRMISLAREGAQTIEVHSMVACYQPGEAPALIVSARTHTHCKARVTLSSSYQHHTLHTFDIDIPASSVLYEVSLSLPALSEPGLYRIEILYQTTDGQQMRQESGFWIWDTTLVEKTRGKRLTTGRDYFYQAGQIFPVFGTTYMDSQVQRKFLTLPDPSRWSRDFAEMKASGINLVRTGIWTAWRELMPTAGIANEAMLRALDAFVMTACAYDIQLIFTFFAFYPPLFEGENPWLDPRSIQAQQDFIAVLARRYASIEIVSWDLINEPSFGDPARIFAKRPIPHYDRYEVAAFQKWLADRYTLSKLQLRWRQTPVDLPNWEQVKPPEEHDYNTQVGDTTAHNMLKVADYTLFSQDMFNQWAARMYATIRACESQTLIGVGQDEAGARIAPQFYASSVDYTTTHPWWNNDALLWDMLLDKTPYKPNLIQETGVMLVRDVDGRSWRSEQENADLLERKLITGLAARGAGQVQWLWHTNSYMTSDNENSIGLVRADGSAKPELGVMKAFGHLMQALSTQMIEARDLPAIWVVIPYSQWFVRPEIAIEATQQAVRVLGYDLGIIPQLVGEHQLNRLPTIEQVPLTIIVPAMQMFDESAWRILQHFVHEGATLLVSGIISRSPHNLPFDPMLADMQQEELQPLAVSRYEELEIAPGETQQLVFGGEKIGYVRKAHNQLKTYRLGEGTIVWSGLPLELSSNFQATQDVYRQILNPGKERNCENSPLLVVRQPLKDGVLVLVVSEIGSSQRIMLDEGVQIEIAPNRAGAVMMKGNQIIHSFGGIHRMHIG